jgi:hypothetical protein
MGQSLGGPRSISHRLALGRYRSGRAAAGHPRSRAVGDAAWRGDGDHVHHRVAGDHHDLSANAVKKEQAFLTPVDPRVERLQSLRNGGGITFGTIPDDRDVEISQLVWARDLSQVRSSRVKAGSVHGRSPLARPVIVTGNQPVGLFFGQ